MFMAKNATSFHIKYNIDYYILLLYEKIKAYVRESRYTMGTAIEQLCQGGYSIAVKKLPFSQRWGNGKRLEIFFELFQHIASGGVLIHNFRMLMAELAPFHHSLILSGLWL